VQSKTRAAKQKQGSYGIQAVPMLVVAGKYRTPQNFSGSFDQLLNLTNSLIAKARAEQGRKH
jgi:hypothetical protein